MSEENNDQQQQQQQKSQEQQLQDLNFSINDILNHNHDVNDSSFQSIVQTLSNNSNEQHITPSYAHLPAELQDLLSNEADDLLSPQGSNSDASILTNDMHLWNQQAFISSPVVNPSPSSALSTPPIQPQQTPPPIVSTPIVSTPIVSTPIISTPIISTPTSTTTTTPVGTPVGTPIGTPVGTPVGTPASTSSNTPAPASSTTLLDNITAQLPAEKKDRFIQLFRRLQSGSVTAEDFFLQARSLLGQQQYQQLEDLKNKPSRFPQQQQQNIQQQNIQQQQKSLPIRPTDDGRKRMLTSSQIRAEDAQRSMPGIITPQLKKSKTEHIPPQLLQQFHQPPQNMQQQQQLHQLQMQLHQQHMQMLQQQQQQQQQLQQQQQVQQPQQLQIQQPQVQQPQIQQQQQLQQQVSSQPISIAQPVFKTPAVPNTPGLQVPTRNPTTSTPTSKPIASAPTTTSSSGGGGGGGDSRIDYEALTDVMGYAGVDLKEEAEHFMKDQDVPSGILPDGIDRSKMQDFMNTEMLTHRILMHAKRVDIKEIEDDFVSYVALATQDRIRTVMESMIAASKHRTLNVFGKPPCDESGHPLFKLQVKQNVQLQIEAINHVARQTELDLDPMEEDVDQTSQLEIGWYSNKSSKPLQVKKKRDNRNVTVQDAIFVMEKDVQGGRGTNQKALLRAYNEWLS